jgi:hypothetical protein
MYDVRFHFHPAKNYKMSFKFLNIIFSFIILWWNFGCSNGQDSVDVVSAPHFVPIAQDQNEQLIIDLYDAANPLIRNLRAIDVTDTTVFIEWSYNIAQSNFGFPTGLIVEIAAGNICEDFRQIDNIETDSSQILTSNLITASYLVKDLQPLSTYRVRIVPIFTGGVGRGFPSTPLVVSTIASPINYWEQILPRRTSKIWYGRGYSDPVPTRPHLSEGVEIHPEGTHSDSIWWNDAPNLNTPVFPSGRKGHSMTLVDNYVYMFGGRTAGELHPSLHFFFLFRPLVSSGYSCASILIDTLNLGTQNSGLDIYPCVAKQNEVRMQFDLQFVFLIVFCFQVNELWLFDITTYEWQFINTTIFNDPFNLTHPQSRELHSATLVDGDLLIFGGKSRIHALDASGNPIMTSATDKVYNDMWLLSIDHLKIFNFGWASNNHAPIQPNMLIPQDKRYYANIQINSEHVDQVYPGNPFIGTHLEGATPRTSQCIKDTMIEVSL